MLWQWMNDLVAWFISAICPYILPYRCFSSIGVDLFDMIRCNRNIKSRAWRIPELCKYLNEKYGKLVHLRLLGQKILIVTDFKIASALMTNHGHHLRQRFGNQYGLQNLNMHLTGLIWNNDVQQWKHNRNIFESTLKSGSKNLEGLALSHLETVEKTTLEIAEPITVLELLRNFTLSMTMEGLFEIPMPNAKNVYDWREEAKTTVANYFKAWEFFLLNPNSQSLAENELHQNACRKMLLFSQEIFAKSEEIGNSNFISSLSHCNDNNGIIQCIAEMLLAGTDTSSITMFYTLLFLADFPDLANKVSRIINTESQEVVDKEIANFYYESMRLIPVGPVILRQCENDIVEGDISLKRGDGIIFNIAGMNRVNYEQPDQFNPYRYETECFPLSFGVGKKSCVGKTFAEREMKLFFTWFLKKYTVLGHQAEMVGLLETRWDVANAPVQDIKLTIFPRKLIYFIGDQGTGKSSVLNMFKANYPKIKIISKEQILEKVNGQCLTKVDHIKHGDVPSALMTVHSKVINNFKSEFVLIESSILDCFINLDRNVLTAAGFNEIELLQTMKHCLVVYFPIFEESHGHPGKQRINENYFDLMEHSGCRYHSLKTRSVSGQYQEILNFIRKSSSESHDMALRLELT